MWLGVPRLSIIIRRHPLNRPDVTRQSSLVILYVLSVSLSGLSCLCVCQNFLQNLWSFCFVTFVMQKIRPSHLPALREWNRRSAIRNRATTTYRYPSIWASPVYADSYYTGSSENASQPVSRRLDVRDRNVTTGILDLLINILFLHVHASIIEKTTRYYKTLKHHNLLFLNISASLRSPISATCGLLVSDVHAALPAHVLNASYPISIFCLIRCAGLFFFSPHSTVGFLV